MNSSLFGHGSYAGAGRLESRRPMGPVSAEIEIDVPARARPSRRSPTSRAALLHRPLPHRLPPHPDRVRAGSARAPAFGSARRCARSGWTPRSPSWSAPHRIVEHGAAGAPTGSRSTTVWELTEGPGSLTTVRVSHWTEPSQPGRPGPGDARRPPRSGRSAAGARRCGGCATCSSPSGRPPAPDRRRRGQPLRDRHPLIELPPPMHPRRRRLVLPLLAALALAALAVARLRLRLLERLQGRRRGRTGEARRAPVQRRLLALPQPQRHRGLGLPGRPAEAPPEGSTYFGVFFEVQNESDEPQTLPDSLTITDADGTDLRRAPERKPLRLPVRRRSRIRRTDPGPRLDRRSRARSRARWCSSCCRTRPPRTGR